LSEPRFSGFLDLQDFLSFVAFYPTHPATLAVLSFNLEYFFSGTVHVDDEPPLGAVGCFGG